MAVLWNPGGQTLILKRNMTISYVKESYEMEKDRTTKTFMENYGNTAPPEQLLIQ